MYLDIILDLSAALCFGALIGMERQWRQRFTGVATHGLVSLGGATFATLGAEDKVVTGIGFLGAGLIMRDGLSVRGLSTAATIGCTGAVGGLTGSGFLAAALVTTLLIVLCNLTLPSVTRWRQRHAPIEPSSERYYTVEAVTEAHQEALLRRLSANGLVLQSLESHARKTGGEGEVAALVLAPATRTAYWRPWSTNWRWRPMCRRPIGRSVTSHSSCRRNGEGSPSAPFSFAGYLRRRRSTCAPSPRLPRCPSCPAR